MVRAPRLRRPSVVVEKLTSVYKTMSNNFVLISDYLHTLTLRSLQ